MTTEVNEIEIDEDLGITEGATSDDAQAGGSAARQNREVCEFTRQLEIAEKNYNLYPVHGKVVQGNLDALTTTLEAANEEVGPLRLQVTQTALLFENTPVYSEENKGKSITFRLYKDGIRDLVFVPGCTRDELESFLHCMNEARNIADEEDDFITLFWEKDCNNVLVQIADDFLSLEDLPEIPESSASLQRVQPERFEIPAEEKGRLEETLENRRADVDDGDSTFELSTEEQAALRALVANEDSYFPILDFLDILLEIMVRRSDDESFEQAVKMIRTVIDSLIQAHDFKHCAALFKKFTDCEHPSLSEHQRGALTEMVESFRDKKTLNIIQEFLTESEQLENDAAIFEFMRSFPKQAASDFCGFLSISQHMRPLTRVLVHLGTGRSELFTNFLEDPDPLIVRAVIDVVLEADSNEAVNRISRALKHRDENVRIHAARTMLNKGDSSAGRFFVPLLQEKSRQLLNIALEFFSEHNVNEAFQPLCELIQSTRFFQLDQKRQIQAYRALLRAAPHKTLELLRGTILKWPFSLTENSHLRKCAALQSLAFSDNEPAVELLRSFANRKRGKLREVAQRALTRFEKRQRAAAKKSAARSAQTAKNSAREELTHV